MWKTLLEKDLYTFVLIVMSFNVTFLFNTCSSIKDIKFVSASVGSGDEVREILMICFYQKLSTTTLMIANFLCYIINAIIIISESWNLGDV